MNASTVKKKTNNYGSIPEQPEEEKEKTFEIDIGLWEASIGLVVYLILGVVAYSFILEKWSMVDSFYFSIVTFTTVGRYLCFCPFLPPVIHPWTFLIKSLHDFCFYASSLIQFNDRIW